MADDTGAADQGAQLQTAMQHIDTLHHTITQSVTAFESLFATHDAQTPAADHSAEVTSAIEQIHNDSTTIAAELGQKLQAAVEAMHTATTTLTQTAQQHATEWDQAHDALKAATTDFDRSLEAAAAGATSTLGQFQSGIQTATTATQELAEDIKKTAQDLVHTVTDTVASTLKKSADEFHDGIASALTGKVTEHITSIYNDGHHAIENLETTASHVCQEFSHEAQQALEHFASQLTDNIKHQLEAAGERLAKDAMEVLTAFVTASVVEGTAGAALTGAMSPILPEVIVVKEASEAIKDLIAVFKAVASIF